MGKRIQCAHCRRSLPAEKVREVDNNKLCVDCLYGKTKPIAIYPIGTVKNDRKRREKGFGVTGEDRSEIHLLPSMTPFMKGLADEERLTIVWYLHKARGVRTTFERGRDGKTVGPFASRTPDRLTPIAVTHVDLLEIKGNILIVQGLDAINGTPVLDIKTGPRIGTDLHGPVVR